MTNGRYPITSCNARIPSHRVLRWLFSEQRFDDDSVFVGSANLDPRSLKLNTEMGLLIEEEI